jgi:hypothetical protein
MVEMSKIKGWLNDDKGMALITVLLILLLLTTLGMYSIWTSSSETSLGGNERLNKMAYYVAEAGLNEAIGRIDVINQASPYYIPTNKTAIGLTRDALVSGWPRAYKGIVPLTGGTNGFSNYSVYVWPTFENDPQTVSNGWFHNYSALPNNHLVLYNKKYQYPDSPMSGGSDGSQGFPVFHVTSIGKIKDPSGRVIATARLSADITKNTINVAAPGGMFSGGCVTAHSNSGQIVGNDSVGLVTNSVGCPPVFHTASGSSSGNVTGSPAYSSNANIDMNTFLGFPLSDIGQYVTMPEEDDNTNYGTSGDTFGVYSSSPAIVFINNSGFTRSFTGCNGYGILVVSGNLTLKGNFTWHGLVYVKGNVTMSGGGSNTNIYGGLMAGGQTNVLNGGINIEYNLGTLERVGQQAFSSKMLIWRDERQ